MKAEFEVNMTVKDMYDFNIYHNYHNISGLAGLVFGVVALFISVYSYGDVSISYTLMMAFFGLLFTIITPGRIMLKSAQQMKLTPMFKKPLKYTVSDENITIEQDDQKVEIPWDDVYRVKDTGKSIVVYITSVRAYIFPKRDVGAQEENLTAVLKKMAEEKKFKIKIK